MIRETIEKPQEIWVGFSTDPKGRVQARRRYVRRIKLDGRITLGLVTETSNGAWSGLTFFHRDDRKWTGMRTGLRIYAAE